MCVCVCVCVCVCMCVCTARRRRLGTTLSVGSWNVRSVVESDGPVLAAAVRGIVSDDKPDP